jgi:hypothetical protein
MANNIKTEPKTLNEWTLEMNIASEIAGLFNSPFHLFYPYRLRWLFELKRFNYHAFKKRKTRIVKLSPQEENKGGGWDTKIQIPLGKNDSRGIFIQFKSGEHNNGNNITGSIFNTTIKNPNKHIEFTFNDNTNNNQHQNLKNLSDFLINIGLSPNSVMYAFPRITQLNEFYELEGDLLLYTTFLTIPEIDAEANLANVNLYNNQIHYFKTCYKNENKREISSVPFQLKNKGILENIIYEILLVKLSDLRNYYKDDFPDDVLNNYLFLTLADYLKVNPMDKIDLIDFFPESINKELNIYFEQAIKLRDNNFIELFGENNFSDKIFLWRNQIFNKIKDFFINNTKTVINIRKDIPSNYSFSLPQEESFLIEMDFRSNLSLLIF